MSAYAGQDCTKEGAVPRFRATKTPGVYIYHQADCPAVDSDAPRCRCHPAYRGRRRHPVTRRPEWSPTFHERAEVLTWLGAATAGADALRDDDAAGRSLADLYDEWIAGAESGAIPSARKGARYSPTTLEGYRRSWQYFIEPEFGPRPAAEIDEVEWQPGPTVSRARAYRAHGSPTM